MKRLLSYFLVSILLLTPILSFAAITRDTDVDGAGNTSMAYTVGSGSNRALVVVVRDSGSGCTAVSYNGVALTKQDTANGPGSEVQTIWTLLSPTTGSNTLSSTGTGCSFIGVASYFGVGSIDSHATSITNSITITTVDPNAWYVLGWRNTVTSSSISGGGATALLTGAWCSNSCGIGDTNGSVAAGGHTVNLSPAASWGSVAVGLAPVATVSAPNEDSNWFLALFGF